MRKIAMFLTAGAVLASGVHADWMLNDYATTTKDSAETNALYGVQSYQNKSSSVTVQVVTAGSVSLIATKIASDGTEGYTANIGMLHPLTPDWAATDITGLTSIDFEFKNSTKITDYFAVSFGSEAYTDEIAAAGTVYEAGISGAAALNAATAFKTASVLVDDFATPKWWTAIPDDFPSVADVLKKVKNLQFAPKTAYTGDGSQNGTACKTCTGPTMTAITLDIRKINLVGVEKVSKFNPTYIGCEGAGVPLDVAFDDNANEAGGYWFNFSDFDSTGTSTDKAKGKSTSSFTTVAGDEFASGSVTLHAGLNKMNGTTWNPYAGWAAIGTGFFEAGWLIGTGLTGIKFQVQADTLPETIEFINFKVGLKTVNDTATHVARLPSKLLKTVAGDAFCARPEDLVQPSYVTAAHRVDFATAMVSGIKQLAWEAKITNDKDSTIKTAQVKLTVSNVVLYGIPNTFPQVGVDRKAIRSARPFGINYANGVLSLKGFDGVSSVDVLSIDGRKVASFAPQATMALDLGRGTYFVSAKRNGATVVQSFAVIGR